MFFEPDATRYDLKFSLFGIPIRVHPMFWALGIFFGSARGLDYALVWVSILFVSILVHELGHSLVMRVYGIQSHIVLYTMGGLAIPLHGKNTTPYKNIAISLAGPFAGFFLAAVAILVGVEMGGELSLQWFAFIPFPHLQFSSYWHYTVFSSILWVNICWGIINLLPVFPLDGGQVFRELFLLFLPNNGLRYSLWLSVITGGALAIWGIISLKSIFMLLLFGSLAYSSYQSLK
ncbi:MAG: site-2 protease family protein [Spirochaetota bacterium]